jgi:hypothetical protein
LGDELWKSHYEFTGTGLQQFPLVEPYPTDLARRLDALGRELAECLPAALCAGGTPTRAGLDAARSKALLIRSLMIALQEELDWRCYQLYGLIDEDLCYPLSADGPGTLPGIALGERAFEIVLARRVAQGELETAWFSRHGSTPITEVPAHWPEAYRRLVERRIALIQSDRNIGLIERPEYKRRWSWTPWEEQERDALRGWLLDRIEAVFSSRGGSAESQRGKPPEPRLTSTARLADRLHGDAAFMDVAAVCTGRVDFDLAALVAELVEAESVPFLPVLRYKDSGLRKRAQWEETWRLQRREDAIDAEVEAEWRTHRDAAAVSDPAAAETLVAEQRRRKQAELGDIPVPPKYASADLLKTSFWRLRGGLDVPKERFVSYPGCERDADRSLPIAWAGWNPLQQAIAIATYYLDVQEREAWDAGRLTPLLAGIQELLPWILQWHNDYDPESSQRMGDYFAGFLAEETRTLGLTLETLRAWCPPVPAGARRGRKPRGGA